jgi:DNA-binding NtrC family response regulator
MIEIKLPSLVERSGDLPLLERYFFGRFAAEYGKPLQRLTRRAEALLASYPWPGNVRELANVLGNACMMTDSGVIDVADLPEHLRNPQPRALSDTVELEPLSAVERRHAAAVLAAVSGNKVQAARILGIHRHTLARLLGDEVEEDADVLSPRHTG